MAATCDSNVIAIITITVVCMHLQAILLVMITMRKSILGVFLSFLYEYGALPAGPLGWWSSAKCSTLSLYEKMPFNYCIFRQAHLIFPTHKNLNKT